VALLDVADLRMRYRAPRGAVRAVDGVSFSIEAGEVLGIIGESGSGKTSLALTIMRLLPPNAVGFEGTVRVDGVDLATLSDDEFRRRVRWREIAMVFQGAMNALNPVLRVGRQITEPLVLHGTPADEARRRAERLLERVGLGAEAARRYPHELSGGMRQRVVIAMALALDPRLVILDEPTSALDASIQAQIMNLLKTLKWELGLSMLFITHDVALASDLADRLAVVHGGEVREEGSAEAVLTNPLDPYTQGLLASIPRLRGPDRPRFLTGAPPDLADPPPGCRFQPRCPQAFAPCASRHPPLLEVRAGQRARCWLYEGR
jgi:oligopeptide/dipeptide ABC transporter ATP-binding protein